MVLQWLSLWLALVISVHFCTHSTAEKVFVTPSDNVSCTIHQLAPCLTLSKYAGEPDQYFLDNTTFIFLPGVHQLDVTLNLENLSNVELNGSDDIHSVDPIKVIFRPSVNITWRNCDNIQISGLVLDISRWSYLEDGLETDFTVLVFHRTSSILSNSTLVGSDSVRAVLLNDSSQVKVINVHVSGAQSWAGSAIRAINSTVHLYGNISFINNTATTNGGAVLLDNSTSIFSGNIAFHNNSVNSSGGAMYTYNSNITIFGYITFTKNKATNGTSINNAATASFGKGGAMFIRLTSQMMYGNISFVNNYAKYGGGAIAVHNSDHHDISGNVAFVNNTAREGGAMFIRHTSQKMYGNISFDNNYAEYNGGAIHVYYSDYHNISGNITFVNNTVSFGEGGAMFIQQTSQKMYGNISFVNNYAKYSGGAIAVYSSNHHISGNVTFVNNTASFGAGGAIFIWLTHLLIWHTSQKMYGNISFVNNYAADSGGAIAVFYSNHHNISGNVTFVNNTVSFGEGGAMFIGHTSQKMYGNISFANNYATDSGGAIAVYDSNHHISGNVTFVNNTATYGGALYLLNSKTNISRNVTFINNTALKDGGAINMYSINILDQLVMTGMPKFVRNFAQRGGAMYFFGRSKLILTHPLQALFNENHASSAGGAVYFHETVSQCTRLQKNIMEDCFIEFSSESDIQLDFYNNTADKAGRVLYGGNTDSCILHIGDRRIDFHYDFQRPIISAIVNISSKMIVNNDSSIYDIAFDLFEVCICVNGDINNLECHETEEETVTGKEFTLQVVVRTRQKKNAPNSYVRAFADNNAQMEAWQNVQKTGEKCTPIHYSLLSGSNSATIKVFPENSTCHGNGLKVKVNFNPCPFGFALSGSRCVCERRLQNYRTKCDINTNFIERSDEPFWMGIDKSDDTNPQLILHSGCPLDYCVDPPVNISLDNPDNQCDNNRSGILCGQCKDNFSIALDKLHCVPCNDRNYFLALILAFAVAGIALVAVLLLLNLTVAVGTINGLIFYANVVQANRSVFFPTNFLSIFVAWLNLDLGIEACFYDGMDIYAYTWLQFVFPVYIWCLIGLIIVMSRYSKMISKYLGKLNPVATLATLILLSYFKILSNIVFTLSGTVIEYPNRNIQVWLYDGSLLFFDGAKHTALGIFAILVLLLLFLPYTLLLIFGHWLQAYSHWRILSWLNKIKPFMDAYHAPYKKGTRYWTGLILLLRCVLFVRDAYSELLIITSVTAGLAALAWIHNGIYEKFFNNITEASFILNLCIFSAAIYHVKQTKGNYQATLAYTSVGIAFAIFICIVVYHVYMIVHNTLSWKKIVNMRCMRYIHLKSHKNDNIVTEAESCIDLVSYAVPPTSSVVELIREP